MSARLVLTFACLAACGKSARYSDDQPTIATDVLRKHAARFGSERAIAALLPVTLLGRDGDGLTSFTILRDKSHERATATASRGIGEDGAWAMVAGVRTRLRPDEAIEPRLDGWLERRRYLRAFDRARDSAEVSDGRVRLTYRIEDLGNPELAFDGASGELVEASHTRADGQRLTRRFRDALRPASTPSVAWAAESRDVVGTGDAERGIGRVQLIDVYRDGACPSPVAGAPIGCASPAPPGVAFEWPSSQTLVAPFDRADGMILIGAMVGTSGTMAILDSGSTVTSFDWKIGRALVTNAVSTHISTVHGSVTGAFGTFPGPLSIIGRDTVLSATNLPVSISDLSTLGASVIIGTTFFIAASVRIDFVTHEIAFAQPGRAPHGAGATAIPLRLLDSNIVLEAVLDGEKVLLRVDTGSGHSLTLHRSWAAAHGASAGEYVVGRTSVGSIAFDHSSADIADYPREVRWAGNIGNGIFERCDAIVIDVSERTLWLEGPCDRPEQ